MAQFRGWKTARSRQRDRALGDRQGHGLTLMRVFPRSKRKASLSIYVFGLEYHPDGWRCSGLNHTVSTTWSSQVVKPVTLILSAVFRLGGAKSIRRDYSATSADDDGQNVESAISRCEQQR